MTRYDYTLSSRAYKYLARLNREDRIHIIERIKQLPEGSFVQMEGEKTPTYRMRVGKYRVIFEKYDNRLLIHVIKVGPRGDVYK